MFAVVLRTGVFRRPLQGIHIRRAGNPQREGRQAEDTKLRAELCNDKAGVKKTGIERRFGGLTCVLYSDRVGMYSIAIE